MSELSPPVRRERSFREEVAARLRGSRVSPEAFKCRAETLEQLRSLVPAGHAERFARTRWLAARCARCGACDLLH